MAPPLDIRFAPLSAPPGATLVVLAGEGPVFGPAARGIDERTKGALTKAARAAGFSGKSKTSIEILAPAGIDAQRILVVGMGRTTNELERLLLGGFAFAQIVGRKIESASLIAEPADLGEAGPDVFAADLALGAVLRSYAFKKYQTRKAENEPRGRDAQWAADAVRAPFKARRRGEGLHRAQGR